MYHIHPKYRTIVVISTLFYIFITIIMSLNLKDENLTIHNTTHDNRIQNAINDNNTKERNLTNDELIDTYLLSQEQWSQELNREDYNEVYKKKIRWNNQLYYFGDTHRTDYKHPEYIEINQLAEEFYQKNKWKRNIILIEWSRWISTEKILSEDVASARQAYVKFAINNNFERLSPEPIFSEELDYVVSKWIPRENYAYYYIARAAVQRHRWPQTKTIEKYLDNCIGNDIEFESILWKTYSLELFEELHRDIFEEKRDINHHAWFRYHASPIHWSPVNEVSKASWHFRDLYISKVILEFLDKWYNILTSFGRSHLSQQCKIYDRYFEQQEKR